MYVIDTRNRFSRHNFDASLLNFLVSAFVHHLWREQILRLSLWMLLRPLYTCGIVYPLANGYATAGFCLSTPSNTLSLKSLLSYTHTQSTFYRI